MAAESETVTQWVDITMDLIKAAGDYAAATEEDPEMSAMVRKLKVISSAFSASLNTIRWV